ncbi:DNA-directed RNA polymerase I subunit RPA12 [Neocloeon triangulifer]|uniref:DNA-directed RNA polymerase I subunit RPA12 n=1 Tax=Neocloeon triangulifer TaxID=2078957 RepID=UPI00286F44DD|nr:DNA-directed RNA polymerase I subunit RPA12 [Neocloeon triangulifer]
MTTPISNMDFCASCGSIMPVLQPNGGLTCYTCTKSYPVDELDANEVHYVLHFNSVDADQLETEKKRKKKRKHAAAEAEGPVVERKCPKCGNDVMSYATLQLRSADEGQTVFYTCTKCKYKETENS